MNIQKLAEIELYFHNKAHDPSYDLAEKQKFQEFEETVRAARSEYYKSLNKDLSLQKFREMIVTLATTDNLSCPEDYNMDCEYPDKNGKCPECEDCWAESLEKFEKQWKV